MKEYLGDGVYVEVVEGRLVLTVENGIEATDTIYLDIGIYDALAAFVSRMRRENAAATDA